MLENALAEATAEVREVNETNGWFDEDRRPAEGLALLHSEVSEWLEALRSWGTADATPEPTSARPPIGETMAEQKIRLAGRTPKPEGAGSEAADVFIRLLDECDRQGIDLAWEYRRKIAYNRTRGYRHGGRSL